MTSNFHVDVSFDDATGRPVAAYLRVREGTVTETREVKEGVASPITTSRDSCSASNFSPRAKSKC
jgi:hypothetical protein